VIEPCWLFAAPAALVIDRVLGDPAWLWRRLPHPVVLFGRAVDALDNRLNVATLSFAARRRRGVLALAILVGTGGGMGLALQVALTGMPFGIAVEAVLASVLLAHKSLVDHVAAVARGLDDDLQSGRQAVAQIVGRDVVSLDQSGVARAAIESAAENFADGVVAPVFWLALLGLPGLIVFKIVNTADSMIGHRTDRHRAFGWAAARFDDLLNIIPARLSAALLIAAAFSRRNAPAAARAAWRDASRHRSPNAGWPEAAAAGALGLALGGPRRYGVLCVDGAWLNPEGRHNSDAADIRSAIRLVDIAWAVLLALVAAIALWIAR
jgi:adenosylcobinamide-phosphate synthase